MPKSFDNYIFDMDGTIVNSSFEILKCFKQAFEDASYDVAENRFTSDVIGPPVRPIIRTLAPEINKNNEDIVAKNFRTIYDNDKEDISCLYEGILDYLKTLEKAGKRLFIATFKPKAPAKRLMKNLKLNMFEAVYTVDYPKNFVSKTEMVKDIILKYNLDIEKTVMIGDAKSDMLAGKENNVYAVGVMWGYGSDKTEFIKSADMIIEDIEGLKCLK